MGKALEWLGEGGCESLFGQIVNDVQKKGRRLWAPCPIHGGTSHTAFHYEAAKDMYFCHKCGATGDLIELYAALRCHGQDKAESFKAFAREYGPPPDPEKYKEWLKRQKRGARPVEGEKKFSFTPSAPVVPPMEWQARAAAFVSHSCERLTDNADALAWLAGRGISQNLARQCCLGWNDKFKSFPASAWGLDLPDAKIYLSPGLVIPVFQGENLLKIKIRRFGEITKGPRYFLVQGSSTGLALYGRGPRVMIVEGELDAVLLWGLAERRRDWTFIATGGNRFRPDSALHERLLATEHLAVSFDNDEAGRTSFEEFWRQAYPQARPWPISVGKDPGEAFQAGVDLGVWLESF